MESRYLPRPSAKDYVEKAKANFFYFFNGAIIVLLLAIFLLETQGKPVNIKDIGRLIHCVIMCMTFVSYMLGYHRLGKFAFLGSFVFFSLSSLFYSGDIIDMILSMVGTRDNARYFFAYEPKIRKISSNTICAASCGAIILYYWMYISSGLFPPQTIFSIQTAIIIVLVMILSTFVDNYFDDLCQHLFDEVKINSEEIEKESQAKEAFFACISHEIRSPLQSIIGSVDLLQAREKDSVAEEFLQIMRDCCDVVLNIISNVLDLSKIRANNMELSKVPIDIRETINKIVRLLQVRVRSKGIGLSFLFDKPSTLCLNADPARLTQVIMNIVSNAIKFTSKGKVIVKLSTMEVEPQAISKGVKKALSSSTVIL